MGFQFNMAEAGILGVEGKTVNVYPDPALGSLLAIDSINILGTAVNPYTLAVPNEQLDGSEISPGSSIIIKRIGGTVVNITGLVDGVTYTPATPLVLERQGQGFDLTYSNDGAGWISISAAGSSGIEILEDVPDVNYQGETPSNGDILLYNPTDNEWQLGSSIGYDTGARFPLPPSVDSVETTFTSGGTEATLFATVTDPDKGGDVTFDWNRQGSTTRITSTDVQTPTGGTTSITATANGVYELTVTDHQNLTATESVSVMLFGAGPEGTLAINDNNPTEGDMVTLTFTFADQTATVTNVSLAPIDADGAVVGNFVFNQPVADVPGSPVMTEVPLLATGVVTAYRLTVEDSDNMVLNIDLPITVQADIAVPTISLAAFTNVAQNTATIVATVDDDGGAPVTSMILERQGAAAPNFTMNGINLRTGDTVTFNLLGLEASTAYTYGARGTNSAGQGVLSNTRMTTTAAPLLGRNCRRGSGNPLANLGPNGGSIVFQPAFSGGGNASVFAGGTTDAFGSLTVTGTGSGPSGQDFFITWSSGAGSMESAFVGFSVAANATHEACSYREDRTSF